MSDLFDPEDDGGKAKPPVPSGHGGPRPGAGRKPGSLSRVNQDLRHYLYELNGGEPIVEQHKLAALPLMDDDERRARAALAKIMRRFRCTRLQAANLWMRASEMVFPHLYPKLGSLEIKAPGTPGAEPLPYDVEGEAIDVTDLPIDDVPAPGDREEPA